MLHSFDEKLFDLLEKYMGMEVAPRYTLLTAKLFTLLTLLTWFTLLKRFTLFTLFILLILLKLLYTAKIYIAYIYC